LHLTEVAEELVLDYSLLVLRGHGYYGAKHYGISQRTLMRAGACPAGPQLLPALLSALVSALQRTVLVTVSLNHAGEVIPALKGL